MSEATLVLQGSLDETSLDEILGTISLSRSCMRLELDEGRSAIVVKAGQLLRARTGDQVSDARAAFQALRQRQRGTFRLFRDPYEGWHAPPIASLVELLARPGSGIESPADPDVLLVGTANDANLEQVLGILSLSRQRLELRLERADGVWGVLLCKAGLICGARIGASGATGRPALLELRRGQMASFELRRVRSQGRLPRPIGSLVELRRGRAEHHSVIRGRFDEHSFLDILQIVTASRQILEITVTRGQSWRGMLLVKAGQLLLARTDGGETGVGALAALIADPGDAFDAVLAPDARLPATPLGDLRQLTASAAQGSQDQRREDRPSADAFDEEITAVQQMPTPTPDPTPDPAAVRATQPTPAPPRERARPVDLAPLEEQLARIEQQLASQDALLRAAAGEAAEPRAPARPSVGLLIAVLVAQIGVAGLLLVFIGILVMA